MERDGVLEKRDTKLQQTLPTGEAITTRECLRRLFFGTVGAFKILEIMSSIGSAALAACAEDLDSPETQNPRLLRYPISIVPIPTYPNFAAIVSTIQEENFPPKIFLQIIEIETGRILESYTFNRFRSAEQQLVTSPGGGMSIVFKPSYFPFDLAIYNVPRRTYTKVNKPDNQEMDNPSDDAVDTPNRVGQFTAEWDNNLEAYIIVWQEGENILMNLLDKNGKKFQNHPMVEDTQRGDILFSIDEKDTRDATNISTIRIKDAIIIATGNAVLMKHRGRVIPIRFGNERKDARFNKLLPDPEDQNSFYIVWTENNKSVKFKMSKFKLELIADDNGGYYEAEEQSSVEMDENVSQPTVALFDKGLLTAWVTSDQKLRIKRYNLENGDVEEIESIAGDNVSNPQFSGQNDGESITLGWIEGEEGNLIIRTQKIGQIGEK